MFDISLICNLFELFSELWACPDGYLMLFAHCYKLIRIAKTRAAAQKFCEGQGRQGQLANPLLHLQVHEKGFLFKAPLNREQWDFFNLLESIEGMCLKATSSQ